MGSVFAITKNRIEVAPGVKLLKAADYAVLAEASALLENAQAAAEKMAEDAKAAYEEEKKRGYEDGMIDGKMEMAERMLDNVGKALDYLESMEASVVDVVMRALRNIVAEIPPEELIVSLVKKALHHVRDQKRITLRVNMEQADAVQEKLGVILKSYPGIGLVDVMPDSNIPENGCIMETEMGVVDASLDRQIELMENTFKRNLSEKSAK
jgi:type III secretion protein L